MTHSNNRKSLLCPGCRKLISSSAEVCPFCNLKNPTSRVKNNVLSRGLSNDVHLITLLISVNIIMFILAILLDPKLANMSFSPLNFLSPSNQSLMVLGSTGTIPLFGFHRYWTLLSANYLHGGLLHILFNMLALRQLAPLVTQEFGINRTIVIYTLGGVTGFLISSLAGVRFTIGASASLCSLIGAMLYYGKSRGGVYGQNIFSQLGGWAMGIALFGFMIPGINNWGHGGGMVAGALLGFMLSYREKRRENFGHKVLAMVCIGATCLILLWSCMNGFLFILFRNQ